MKRRIVSFLLAFCLVISLLPMSVMAAPLQAADFADTGEHWAKDSIDYWSGEGILNGSDGFFRPNDPITRAELAAIINRVVGYQHLSGENFSDVPADAWYAADISKLHAAGVMLGDGSGIMRPAANITREEAVVMIARAFGVEENAGNESPFPDAGEISGWASYLVDGMKAAGYISGDDAGKFNAKNNLTRAETVRILDNMCAAYYGTPGEFSEDVDGNAIVAVAGVTLKDMKISGDLYITEGVGDGDVFLENVEVGGNTFVRGGGKNSLHFINCTIKEMVITKTAVRIVLSDNTVVDMAVAYTGDGVFEIAGGTTIGTLTIIGEGMTILASGGAVIETLNADAGNTAVDLTGDAKIGTANLNGETKVSGDGKIDAANINVDGCELETAPENTVVKEGVNSLVGGKTVTGGDAAPPSAPSQSGGGSGSSSSGGSDGGGTVMPVFSRHNAPNKPNTPYGTPFAELSLPATVTLIANTGASVSASVVWRENTYNPLTEGSQTVVGDVFGTSLPAWAPATISITVTVLAQPVATTIEISAENGTDSPLLEIQKGGSRAYSAKVFDQNNQLMQDVSVDWSIENIEWEQITEDFCIAVSEQGLVTVNADCTALSFSLVATSGEAEASIEIDIIAAITTKAPQVQNLALDFGPIEGTHEYVDIHWTVPAELPYPVVYSLTFHDEDDNECGGMTSFETGSSDSDWMWNWSILADMPKTPGVYTIKVTTINPNNSALNSEPVICGQTITVVELENPVSDIQCEYLGMDENYHQFKFDLSADSSNEHDGKFFMLDFWGGNGWRTGTRVRMSENNEIMFEVDANLGGVPVILEACSFQVMQFTPPAEITGETVVIALQQLGEIHANNIMP